MTVRVGILGATGYGGGELLRLLGAHPSVEVVYATSRTLQGAPVGQVHRNLDGLSSLVFSAPDDDELVAGCDVVFGALPHGASAERLAPLVERGLRVVDLSGDFRLRDRDAYHTWYRRVHPRPELLERAVYGSPELRRDEIRGAQLVASPGCFATAIELALLPAACAGAIGGTPQVVAMTASSGSGAEASAGTHHPTRAGTLRPYKVLAHQHVPEVVQLLRDAGADVDGVSFTPVSAPLVRGILAVVTAPLVSPLSTQEVETLYAERYAPHPFVKVVTAREPECGGIAGTNYAEVRARVTPEGWLHAVVAIDNLVKGGAGQAIQNMNLLCGFDETAGLTWPGMWP
jgi:N-acetyl-gamma-glutamyl-phosphate/LysW-gamma-L-alpha-aminoadipyl-6-phosphate reductase